MTITLRKPQSIGERLHAWVDARNERISRECESSAESVAWSQQLETLRQQAVYADEMRQAMNAATDAGLRTMHACGMYRYTGELHNATGREVLDWWRSQGGN